MKMPRLKVLTTLSLATLFGTAFGQASNPARPGTLNYVEGHVALEGSAVTPNSVGSAALNAGQSLATSDGRAEILLTPGVFLRIDHDSTVKMVSPNLTKTEVVLDRGRAELEVDALYKQNDLLVDDKDTQTKVLERGLYEFDASAGQVKVFEGKAAVSPNPDAKWIDIKGGHEFVLNGSSGKPQHFDKSGAEDDFYNWSSLRANYLGEANQSLLAQEYDGAPGVSPGWAWNSRFDGYTWLPYDGFPYSPFGFYSPGFFYGGGFRGGSAGSFGGRGFSGGGSHGGGGRR